MPDDTQDSSVEGAVGSSDLHRRRMLEIMGVGGLAGLAGCSSGDSPTPTDTDSPGTEEPGMETATDTASPTHTASPMDTASPTATDTDTDTASPTDTETPSPTAVPMQRYSPTLRHYRGPPIPADAQYQPYAPTLASWSTMFDNYFWKRSPADSKFYGQMVENWEYEPGVLDFELVDNNYFWTGEHVTAETALNHLELIDYMEGGATADAFEHIVRTEQLDTYTARLYLADTYNEQFALQNTLGGDALTGTNEFYGPFLEQFRDATTTDEIRSIRDTVRNTTEKDPRHFHDGPFKVVDTEEDRWLFKLRTSDVTEGDYTPLYVDEINYTDFEVIVSESNQRKVETFNNGNSLWRFVGDDYDPGFDTRIVELVRPTDAFGYAFNCSQHPFNNHHFRRAWAYMVNREQSRVGDETNMKVNEVITGLGSTALEERFGDDLLDSLTDYGPRQVMQSEAEQELMDGGFEQDSDGNWLYQEGENEGEPIEVTVPAHSWQGSTTSNATYLENAMDDLGISVSHQTEDSLSSLNIPLWTAYNRLEYTAGIAYWGGAGPISTYSNIYGNQFLFGAPGAQFPETIDLPPVGEPNSDTTETFEPVRMANQLSVTTNTEQFNQLTRQLMWVTNQAVPKFGVAKNLVRVMLNTGKYDVVTQEEAPNKWIGTLLRAIWNNGGMSFVPEGER